MDALLPGDDWNTDRGYQWNCNHFVMDANGQPMDVLVHASAGFPATTTWVASTVGFYGKSYKDLMRRFRQRAGVFLFQLKPKIFGRVTGDSTTPLIVYPAADTTGLLEPKILTDLVAGVRQVASVFKRMGAITTFPNANDPQAILERTLTLFVTTSGALHPQGTCRAGASPKTSVVDSNCMSHDVKNLMCCDASVIPHHISSNPNSMIMAIASRASEFVIAQVLGKTVAST
jgi:choline dehydrogenase-like flavoprotein